MLEYIKAKGLKPTPWELKNGIGKGYLKQSAEVGRNIGLEIVSNFILSFPEVDANWLITGHPLRVENNEKHTAAIKRNEPTAEDRERVARLELEVAELMRWKENTESRVTALEKKGPDPLALKK